jgi:CubicO group peptidase (beta-lactamase class C family)
LRDQTGGFDVLRIDESSVTRVVALAQERDSDIVVRLTFEVGAAEPHRVVRFGVQGVPRPAEFAIPRLTEPALASALRTHVERLAATDKFAGAVLVARAGTPIFTAAFGLADRERAVANTVATRFRNGSMNKMFTAVATLSLVQAGKLALDDPMGKYLTDYPNRDVASRVTIHHLLTHTGATGDVFGPEFVQHRLELRSHQNYIDLFAGRELVFAPGSRWAYSNYGFVLLGAVIEKVSGQNYYDYVREHVYAPAGMTATGSEPEDVVFPNRAIGYLKAPGATGWQPNTGTLPYRGTAAGGGYTTVEDLLRFANAVTNHRLLNAQFTSLLTTGKVAAPQGQYAYGFYDLIIGGIRAVGHAGGAPGQSGDVLMFPESGYVVAVLANMDGSAPPIARFVANRVLAR